MGDRMVHGNHISGTIEMVQGVIYELSFNSSHKRVGYLGTTRGIALDNKVMEMDEMAFTAPSPGFINERDFVLLSAGKQDSV